jgi:hypothetical protein
MPSSPSFDLDPPPPAYTAAPIAVRTYIYDPDAVSPDDETPPRRYRHLPNVRCVGVAEREGAEAATAQFAYLLDDTLAYTDGWPNDFASLWALESGSGPRYRARPGDRLVVLAELPDRARSVRLLFDGFVAAPQADVTDGGQSVGFSAVGVEVRCWDSVVGGRLQRNADAPAEDSATETGLPVRFNPDGKGNATPEDHDYTAKGFDFPVFLEAVKGSETPATLWTLSRAVRYLIGSGNADEEYVENPDFDLLDDLLDSKAPKEGGFYDPDDPATYTVSPITLGDYDATNRPWPEAVAELLGYFGYGMRFVHEWEAGEPVHRLELYRRDQEGPTEPKEIRLPKPSRQATDPAAADVSGLSTAHDFRELANEIVIETSPARVEVSIVLMPEFEPDEGDATDPPKWLASNRDKISADDRKKYRVWSADEVGAGHWDGEAWVEGEPLDLKLVFPDVRGDDGTSRAGYVRRYRPGRSSLVSKDAAGRPRKALLALSRDYEGEAPAVWDGTGHWQPIAGSWKLLDDRLGIEITADDVQAWSIGDYQGPDRQQDGKALDVLRSIATPDEDKKDRQVFFLRLTTVIDGDFGVEATAEKRDASPSPFRIVRRVEARDHYRRELVSQSSPHFEAMADMGYELDDAGRLLVRDDEPKAVAKASQIRAAREFPPIAASVKIPRLDFALAIGDRVSKIDGRDVSLLLNAKGEAGEAPSYPFVVGRTLDLSGDEYTTTIQLSDRRMEADPIGRRA